jgi:quinol monooxygenase YgiN
MVNLIKLVHVAVDQSSKDQLLNKLRVDVHTTRKEEECFLFGIIKNNNPYSSESISILPTYLATK